MHVQRLARPGGVKGSSTLILIRNFMVNTLEGFKIFILEECISATLLKRLMKELLACELRSLVKMVALT